MGDIKGGRSLLLEKNCHDFRILRLEKDWILVFYLDPFLFDSEVHIYTNYPGRGEYFRRETFKPLIWENPIIRPKGMLECRLKVEVSGSFHYYVQNDDDCEKLASGYFVVSPTLRCEDTEIPFNCIKCITYISKNLGTLSCWREKLKVAKECHYNMIHFTPIQELGSSGSAYSIANQVRINPAFEDTEFPNLEMDNIVAFTETLRTEWKMLSICDVVLNHTANNSQWLREHPECAYNMINSPHLKAAYLLDVTLYNFSSEVANGEWGSHGLSRLITNQAHLDAISKILSTITIPKMKIEELFIVPVDSLVSKFLTECKHHLPPTSEKNIPKEKLRIIQDPFYRRMQSTIDMNLALQLFNIYRNDCFNEDDRLKKSAREFRTCLEKLNQMEKARLEHHLHEAVDNVLREINYKRIDPNGTRLGEITAENPLFTRYFTDYKGEPLEEHMYTDNGAQIMAHNGWVMNADPMKNFAESNSQVYLRRELIAWGDCVKLRYGEKLEDCPYLWRHMREYVEQTVEAFDGIRLDNCHSTPIHVAEYLLDAARLVKPDLYVVAELFTNSTDLDKMFVIRLGITSLIRESLAANDLGELGRYVYKYSGEPVGAFPKPHIGQLPHEDAHALFLDYTHDNPCPIIKRTVFDLVPNSALVAMTCCAIGSTAGYDQLVPHQIDVVTEHRVYPDWNTQINMHDGIIAAKKTLNELHFELGAKGYSQMFVDQLNHNIVSVSRYNPWTNELVVLVAFTAFCRPNELDSGKNCRPITINGYYVEQILIEAYLSHKSANRYTEPTDFTKDEFVINGLMEYVLNMKTNLVDNEVSMVRLENVSNNITRVVLTEQFKPGCIVAIKFAPTSEYREIMKNMKMLSFVDAKIINKLTLMDINKILYCCDGEDDIYHVPNYGNLVYCGLQGIISVMENVALNNQLDHPICHNLREGNWLIEYTVNRLKKYNGIHELVNMLEEILQPITRIPRHLVPCYFYFFIKEIYDSIVQHAHSLMPRTMTTSPFKKLLALASIQFAGVAESSPLPPLSKNMHPPIPPLVPEKDISLCITLAAGLPHFAVGWSRNWGRDTFISLRGLLLLTGRFDEARYLILAYAGCLRHGLIPNLLNGGQNARYNCRDAVWWWLYSIKNYVKMAPNGTNILNDMVNRLYPTDDSPLSSVDQPLHMVIQEALSKHFQGLCFRERNAGKNLDEHMTSAGFDIEIGVEHITGFVFGGNKWNCGTWMDKMGSSEKAKNQGFPATSRDGSAIELVALCFSAVSWLAEMSAQKLYPYSGVKRTGVDGTITQWTYTEWANRIMCNFEKCFWISLIPRSNDSCLVDRRGIYKDSYGAIEEWCDYQLRCNYSVAIVIAPELFSGQKALIALETARELLLGPLGMKTLDPRDWNYNGEYTTDDSEWWQIAKGFNYHQGPEWVWPVGYFIRARLLFASKSNNNILSESKSYLWHHYKHMQNSDWRGLPELTNKDGTHCSCSCPTQAWSVASILEAIHEINELETILTKP